MKYLLLSATVLLFACTPKPRSVNRTGNQASAVQTPSGQDANSGDQAPTEGAQEFVHFEAPCASCHEETRPLTNHVQSMDCVGCHTYPQWSNVVASTFSHTPKPESCESCHARPDQGDRAYPLQGPPADFVMDADYPGSGHYKGKDCIECHQTPDENPAEAFVFNHSSPNPNACLPCHFNDGQGEHGNDNDVMLQNFGNCQDCHKNFDTNQNRNFDSVNGD